MNVRLDPAVLGTRLWSGVVGQDSAVATLQAAVPNPLHAYLLVGPPGSGKTAAAMAFAAALLCPAQGDGTCNVCRRVREGVHPDVSVVERTGPAITIEAARGISRLASRTPMEAGRQVLILTDFHLVQDAGPALLKTVEEPAGDVVFVILADYLPVELQTIASRSAIVEFDPLSPAAIIEALVADGVTEETARSLAEQAGGRLDRARLLAAEPGWESRRAAWASVPGRLDGTGAAVARLADELAGLIEDSEGPLRQAQQAQLERLEARNAQAAEVATANGKLRKAARSSLQVGLKEMEDLHKRQLRRRRADELKTGLAVLASAYRDRLDNAGSRRSSLDAIAAVQDVSAGLLHNPGEQLTLEALLSRLTRVGMT